MTSPTATLIASCIAAGVSILSLIATLLANRSVEKLKNKLSDSTNVKKESREYLLNQLCLFYDPIFTLLAANRRIFQNIGPGSALRNDEKYDQEENSEVWSKLVEEVILPNNEKICEIIKGNLHYISHVDNEATYLEFVTHAHAYRVFKTQAYEAYTLFQFPRKFYDNVSHARDFVRGRIDVLYN